eukprot:GEZU01034428.1.p1 GENE.GEZU01034428.1~~GEZU01034428.1.p1  ORF type:complete len:442 (+),score=121.89 GEZU01034428.1:84-1409(+)
MIRRTVATNPAHKIRAFATAVQAQQPAGGRTSKKKAIRPKEQETQNYEGIFAESNRNKESAQQGADQDTSAAGRDESWQEFYDLMNNSIPVDEMQDRTPPNHNKHAWLFTNTAPFPQLKPNTMFEKRLEDWRKGDLMDMNIQLWAESMKKPPIFRRKPENPLPPQADKLIDYRNLHFLRNFISPGGQILNPRYTGVRQKTQRKIAKHIKRARFLGLIPFTGHPFHEEGSALPQSLQYNGPDSIPHFMGETLGAKEPDEGVPIDKVAIPNPHDMDEEPINEIHRMHTNLAHQGRYDTPIDILDRAEQKRKLRAFDQEGRQKLLEVMTPEEVAHEQALIEAALKARNQKAAKKVAEKLKSETSAYKADTDMASLDISPFTDEEDPYFQLAEERAKRMEEEEELEEEEEEEGEEGEEEDVDDEDNDVSEPDHGEYDLPDDYDTR